MRHRMWMEAVGVGEDEVSGLGSSDLSLSPFFESSILTSSDFDLSELFDLEEVGSLVF